MSACGSVYFYAQQHVGSLTSVCVGSGFLTNLESNKEARPAVGLLTIKCSMLHSIGCKGPFINYVRVPREGLEKSLHTLTLGRGWSNPFLRNIFQVNILY